MPSPARPAGEKKRLTSVRPDQCVITYKIPLPDDDPFARRMASTADLSKKVLSSVQSAPLGLDDGAVGDWGDGRVRPAGRWEWKFRSRRRGPKETPPGARGSDIQGLQGLLAAT